MLVRSTFNSRLRYMSSQNVKTASEMAHLQEQITTGKRITKLSDDPWATSELHQIRRDIERQEMYTDSSDRATTILNTVEYALTSAITLTDRAKMLSIQFGNDTYSEEQRQAGAEEVLLMKDRLKEVANTDFHGRYVFSGQGYDTPPFDTTFAYVGSSSESTIDVSEVSDVTVGYVGSSVFQGNVDIFQILDDLATALDADDGTNIRAAIDSLDIALQTFEETRTQVGMHSKMAMDMAEVNQSLGVELETRLSSVEDADMAEVITRFSLIQTQYEINLQLTSKTRQMTLFSRM